MVAMLYKNMQWGGLWLISSGVSGTRRHEARHIIPQHGRGGCCSYVTSHPFPAQRLAWLNFRPSNKEWLTNVSFPGITIRFPWHTHTHTDSVPSYMVMMCGWQSVDMISISLRMWTWSCSSLILSFLIDFMATLKRRGKKNSLKICEHIYHIFHSKRFSTTRALTL